MIDSKKRNLFILKRCSSYFLKTGKHNLFHIIWICLFLLLQSNQAFAQYAQNGYPNNFSRRNAFQQEIARLEITVERAGETPLPMSLVPRVQANDVLKIRMLDEPINGIRPDESFWDWTLVVAFINPSRNENEEESVSREINFKRDGWYREHSFKVPYDSQPVFFLYPKSKYRNKIQKLINKDFNEIKKIGEKTLEIAGAYAQIGNFLNELQGIINRNPYGGGYYGGYNSGTNSPFGRGLNKEQLVERLAQSFNITLPNCWESGGGGGSGSFYGSNDFISRAQCVSKNVRLEDFDFSVGRMLQQGGLLAATQLVQKYPQLAYWINVAAAAADLIIKIMKKTALKIVPAIAQVREDYQNNYNSYGGYNEPGGQTSILPPQTISLFAETPPTDAGYVSAFPVVLHKWQSEADPEVIKLPVPTLLESCLHTGQNILKNSDLSYDWLRDPFARDFRLVMSSENGFSREFRLTKNMGMSGWMLTLNPPDVQAFPKVKMAVESKIVATRGFNRIESEKFAIPISGGGQWAVAQESLEEFSVGGKRRVVIKNTMGSCFCLQTVTYKPSFGGEFVFAANSDSNPLKFNEDGSEAWFEIDTTNFQAGEGTMEFREYGNEQQPQNIQVNLYNLAPEITKLAVHRGDNKVTIEGSRIEQITMLNIDGKIAQPEENQGNGDSGQQQQQINSRTFIFQNPSDLILSNTVSLEMQLEGGRSYKYPKSFPVLPAKPAIETDEQKQIEAVTFSNAKTDGSSSFDLKTYPVIPVDTENMTVTVKTTLADYIFKAENINIETHIENGQVGQEVLPQTNFEVLDTLTLRINFAFNNQYQQFLAGRRLQFRIKDRVRGVSDWVTIKQTFVRIPQIESVNCVKEECRVIGSGLDYIGQVSADGGSIWQPPPPLQPTSDGKSSMTIPAVKDKKLLRIKLRDFPNTEGLPLF